MCGILGPTAGESWVAYVGVPDEYPQLDDLAREIDDAMWEAAQDVLRARAAADPLLRVLADDRCGLWETAPYRAGDLPVGARFSVEATCRDRMSRMYGQIRPLNRREQDRAVDFPELYANEVGIDWLDRDGEWPGSWPQIQRDTQVTATVPIPFDLSALLAVIDAEQGTPPAWPVSPARRRPVRKGTRRART